MKKLNLCLLLILLSVVAGAQNLSWNELKGRWVSDDGAGFEIRDSSQVMLIYNGEKKPVSGCTADLKTSPGWFDFTVSDSSGTIHVKSLVQRLSGDAIQWQVFEGERPSVFDKSKGDILVLKRRL